MPPFLQWVRDGWQVEHTDMPPETRELLDAGEPVIFALWHGRMFTMLKAFELGKVSALISPSRDGEIYTDVGLGLGMAAVIRGSHKRQGATAMREMIRELTEVRRSLLFFVDGPRGPRYVVKPGIIRLASLTGAPIVPVTASSRVLLKKMMHSWDHFHAPFFFARMSLGYGEPFWIPEHISDNELAEAAQREALEEDMRALTRRLDERYGYAESF